VENGAERAKKSDKQSRAGAGENERSGRSRSSKWAESAIHVAKACFPLYNLQLHFLEAKRGPGPGTSPLYFGAR